MSKPKLVPGMGLSDSKYFKNPKGITYGKNDDFEVLKEGYSRVPHQDAPNPVAYTQSKKQLRGGGFEFGEKKYIYDKVNTEPQQASAPVMPEVEPEPIPQPVPEASVVPSQQQQQAQNLVNDYTSSIIQNSGISSQIYASPADAFYEKPATSFLNAKKIQFGKGFKLQ